MLKIGVSNIWWFLMADQRTDLPENEVKECLVDFQMSQLLYWAAFQKTRDESILIATVVATTYWVESFAFVSSFYSFYNSMI